MGKSVGDLGLSFFVSENPRLCRGFHIAFSVP